MTDITQIKAQRYKESEGKRFNNEINSQKETHNREYKKIVNENEGVLTDIRKDYDTKVSGLKTELEKKLQEIRLRHEEVMSSEQARMAQELDNIKKQHVDQIQEIKTSQQGQIDDMNASQKNSIENSRQKFLKAKLKWES